MRPKELRKLGFSQRRPVKAGVYFIVPSIFTQHMREESKPSRIKYGWDLANIYFKNSHSEAYDAGVESGHWYVEEFGGCCHGWGKGMWIKGPIDPKWEAPRPA